MRILRLILCTLLTALLSACDQQHAASEAGLKLGLECFESHRASLLPGTQYEGIEKLTENRVAIKIMNGVDVVTIDCKLNPDGTLQGTGK